MHRPLMGRIDLLTIDQLTRFDTMDVLLSTSFDVLDVLSSTSTNNACRVKCIALPSKTLMELDTLFSMTIIA